MEIVLRVTNNDNTVETTIEDIRINKKLSDLIDIEKKYNNFTWEFEVVGDKPFNEFMDFSYSINTQFSFNPNKSLDASINISNSGTLIEGSLRLLNTAKVENGNIIYTFQLVGFIRDLFSIMDDWTLSSLDFSEYDHIRTIDHIKENIEDNVIYLNNQLTTDNIDDRQGYVYPHTIYNSIDNVDTHLTLNNMYPAIYFKTLINKIETTLDVDLGNFFKSPTFDNVVIPYSSDNIKKTEEQINDQSTRIGLTNDNPLTPWRNHGTSWWKNSLYPGPQITPNQDINGLALTDTTTNVINLGSDYQFQDNLNSWTGDRYVCQIPGYYDLRFNGKLRLELRRAFNQDITYQGGGSFEYYYRMRINNQVVDQSFNATNNGMTLFMTPPGGTHSSPFKTPDVFSFNLSQNNVFLEEDDVVTIEYGFRFPSGLNFTGNNELIDARLILDRSEVVGGGVDYTRLEVIPSDNNSYGGETFSLQSILPQDLTINDFMSDLIKLFNLVIIPKGRENGRQTFDILPENDYFNTNSSTTKDLSSMIDQYSNMEILPMNESNYKQYVLELESDEDMYNKDYQDNTSHTYGRKRLNIENDFTNDKKFIKPKNIAASILSDEYTPNRPSLYFLKDDLSELKGKLRLLKTKTLNTTNWQIWRAPDSSERVNVGKYVFMSSWDDPTNPDFNLNFSTPNKVYHNTPKIPENNLYTRYWRNKINNIINPEAKRITISNAYMSYLDYINFDFRDVYTLDGIRVRITSLGNYNPTIERLSVEAYTILEDDYDFISQSRDIVEGIPKDIYDSGISIKEKSGLINEDQFDKPYTIPERINRLRRSLNSSFNPKTITSGERSIIKETSSNIVNNGNKVNILNRVQNAVVSDNNKTVTKDGLYVANTKLESGLKSLKWNSVYIINGNDSNWKTNNTDVLHGGEDSVRNKGGIRHDRIIINGNIEGSSLFGGSTDSL